ncbi:SMC-Scp complex subunit ScpB [Micromonospora sp. SH-82]|uniref:SMC-Scp complex subunit ScpB n=1 Tax=Micromonospora sp. SH-82 TaxID=3132938 RepID=UPI003EBF9875
MSDEQRRDSLADQAAAWVPPWAPERRSGASQDGTGPEPSPPTPSPEDPDPAPASDAAPTSDPDPTPASASDAFPTSAPDPTPAPASEAAPASDPDPTPASDAAQLSDAAPTSAPVPAVDSGSTDSGSGPVDADLGTGAPGPVDAAPGADENRHAGRTGRRGRGRRTAPEPVAAPTLDDDRLRGALEAILLVVDEPVSELLLAQIVEQSPERVGRMLDEIAAGYTAAGHGFDLRRAAGGWRLYTRPEYAGYVERFILDGQSVRLTQAALEALAVVAYRQPVSRSRISAIRGVNCDGVIRTLVSRGLVEECGTEPDSGAFLYRTTTLFLEKLGLNSVAELPPLAPFLPDDVEELADATR